MSISAVAATTSSTNYPILVNGYLCYSASDAQAARSGQKPQKSSDALTGTNTATNATNTTSSHAATAQAHAHAAAAGTQTADAVGSSTQSDRTHKAKDPMQRGARIDIYA